MTDYTAELINNNKLYNKTALKRYYRQYRKKYKITDRDYKKRLLLRAEMVLERLPEEREP